MNAALVLGIDAGNTKTIALIADTSGRVLGQGRAGSSNIYVSQEEGLAAVAQAANQARQSAGVGTRPLRAVTLSAAGADWPEDFTLLSEALRRWPWAQDVQVVNDAVGALRAGSLSGLGVAVVCGTSAGIAARSAQGRCGTAATGRNPKAPRNSPGWPCGPCTAPS